MTCTGARIRVPWVGLVAVCGLAAAMAQKLTRLLQTPTPVSSILARMCVVSHITAFPAGNDLMVVGDHVGRIKCYKFPSPIADVSGKRMMIRLCLFTLLWHHAAAVQNVVWPLWEHHWPLFLC